jgi:DNA-binding SARP family transcriptional activator/tetratricopeptide (TPR) repeat protein
MSALSFGLLGPLAVVRNGERVALNTGKLRVVLATLLLRANQTVSVDELVERLWGAAAPSGARKTVQLYAMRLRRTLSDDSQAQPLVQTRPNGYLIDLEPGGLDLARFHQLRDESRLAAHSGDLVNEAARLSEALALWRGRALDDIPSESLQREMVPQLEELRLLVTERRVQVDLELGRHREVIGELFRLTKDHPWHEPYWIQLIQALARSDRLAEALETCRTTWQMFRAELGIDPGEQFQQLHRMLLDGGPATTTAVVPALAEEPGPPSFAAASSQLPPPVRRFVGRADLVQRLGDLLTVGADTDAVSIVNVSGPPGVGKTALALQVAHRLRARFPDGQLYVHLRGYTTHPPLRPAAALAGFLRALGVPLGHIPGDLEGQAALYRSLLTGRRMLVLLDDAADPDQVRPLLPGAPGCVVLVTSRSDLRGLAATQGADHLPLSVLSTADSIELLADLIGAERAAAEPEAVTELAKTCAHLPLALRIAGANLAADPHVGIAEYVHDLQEPGTLAKLAIDGDERAGVRMAIDLSYDRLSPEDRRLFRLLGMASCLDFTASAAAALAGMTPADTTRSLDRLTAVNLMHRSAPRRFQFHDLIRDYATERAHAEDTDLVSALTRLIDFYLHTADRAARLLYPGVPRLLLPPPPGALASVALADEKEALRWLDDELSNLLAAVIRAANSPHGGQHYAWQLVDALRGYVESRGCFVEALTACEAALDAAERAGDRPAQASVLNVIGLISYNLSDFRRVVEVHTKALEQARLSGDLTAQSHCLHYLGRAYTQLGQPKMAMSCHTESLATSRKVGNRDAEALALHYIGVAHTSFGQAEIAIEWHRQALAVSNEIGDRGMGYRALNGLGVASWVLGRLDDARKYHEEVLGYCQEMGLELGVVALLGCLAETSCDAGRFELAASQARETIKRSLEIGDRRAEAGGLEIVATVAQRQGRNQEAIDGYNAALRLAETIDFSYGAASSSLGLARAHRSLGDPALAATLCRRVLVTLGETGMGILEAAALTELAYDHLELGELDAAGVEIVRALESASRRGQRLSEARALHVLGLIRQRVGGREDAIAHWQAALEIFADLRTPELDEIRALLGQVTQVSILRATSRLE